jgi:hypothetical protein
MVIIYSDSYNGKLHIINYGNYTIIGTNKGEYIVGYDKGERLKMSRKVLKNWGRPLSHIFQFEAAPNSGKK